MGMSLTEVQSSLRFSLGRPTLAEDLDQAAVTVAECITRQRKVFAIR
jgi:cysteine sulfinate desulfinase/cysteine desulfurase-like protein